MYTFTLDKCDFIEIVCTNVSCMSEYLEKKNSNILKKKLFAKVKASSGNALYVCFDMCTLGFGVVIECLWCRTPLTECVKMQNTTTTVNEILSFEIVGFHYVNLSLFYFFISLCHTILILYCP